MTLEDLLDRLEKVQKRQGYYMARCPSHVDRESSLSVKEGDDGKILLNCHAGCRTEDIVVALGIKFSDLFADSDSENPVPKNEPEQVYDYVDENGELLFQAVRFPGKKFRQRRPDGEYNLAGVRRVLYRLPEVIRAVTGGMPVFICEGEKDVDAIREAGFVATCNPMGAKKWLDEYSVFLKGANVVIIVDKDDVGREHAAMVRDSLRKVGVEPALRQARKGKDAYDHLVKYALAMKDFVPVKQERVPTVISSNQMADNALKALEARKENKQFFSNCLHVPEPEYIPGRLYILGAWTGHGKSSMAAQEFRYQSEAGVSVGLITNEMTETDFRNRLLCHQGFPLKKLEKPWDMSSQEKVILRKEIERFRSWGSDIIFDTAATHQKAAQYIEDGAYQMLIFDHMHNISSVRSGEESAINKEIGGFASLAVDYDIPILVVGQLRRQPPGGGLPRPSLQDFKGSAGIEQNAAMAMAIWQESNTSAELWILKNRHGPKGYQEYLSFDGPRFKFTKRQTEAVPNVWT